MTQTRTSSADLAGQKVVVVGLARSGIAAAAFLAEHRAQVVATDCKRGSALGAEALALGDRGVRLELGGHRAQTFTDADLVVVSPGVPWELPELEAARRAGVEVIAELELAVRHLRGAVVAITGTKGKSTTTAALGAMLHATGRDVRVGGNIGQPAISLVPGSSHESVFVLEVSSFQLEGIDTFHPQMAVFLNLSDDHLDRHPSREAYVAAKARIFENQTQEDWAVVNAADPLVLGTARQGRARLLPFAEEALEGDGAFFAGGQACLRRHGQGEVLFELSTARVPGAHLALDLLAAAAAARLLGAPPEAIARAVAGFKGAEHVLELVGELRGVRFYNDSKATNIAAAEMSIEAFRAPLLVIMGGRFKGGDFGRLRDAVGRHCRGLLAIGEAQDLLVSAFQDVVPVYRCQGLTEAVSKACRLAQAGDVVLLAPACSSFDMFADYAQRGRVFKDEVNRLLTRAEGEAR